MRTRWWMPWSAQFSSNDMRREHATPEHMKSLVTASFRQLRRIRVRCNMRELCTNMRIGATTATMSTRMPTGNGSTRPDVVQCKTIRCPGGALPKHERPEAGSERSANGKARPPGNTKVGEFHRSGSVSSTGHHDRDRAPTDGTGRAMWQPAERDHRQVTASPKATTSRGPSRLCETG